MALVTVSYHGEDDAETWEESDKFWEGRPMRFVIPRGIFDSMHKHHLEITDLCFDTPQGYHFTLPVWRDQKKEPTPS